MSEFPEMISSAPQCTSPQSTTGSMWLKISMFILYIIVSNGMSYLFINNISCDTTSQPPSASPKNTTLMYGINTGINVFLAIMLMILVFRY